MRPETLAKQIQSFAQENFLGLCEAYELVGVTPKTITNWKRGMPVRKSKLAEVRKNLRALRTKPSEVGFTSSTLSDKAIETIGMLDKMDDEELISLIQNVCQLEGNAKTKLSAIQLLAHSND